MTAIMPLNKLETAAAVAMTLLAFNLVGCSTPAEVVSEGSGTVVVEDDAAPTTTSSESNDETVVVEEDSEDSTTTTSTKLGDTVVLGDWEVTVTKVTLNANRVIKKANMFNEKPQGVYVLVDYKAKYVGDERKSNVDWDLSWTLTDTDQNVLDQASVVTPADDKDWPTEARKGGTVKAEAVFDVDKGKIKGGILSVEDYETYADWTI